MIPQFEWLSIESASPELMQQRALQKRVDTKMVIDKSMLTDLVSSVTEHYALVLSTEQQEARYKNIYFDTDDHLCLRDHHRGRRPRYKVRIRHHIDRSMSFLEVKQRLSNDSTRKHRLPIPFMKENLEDNELSFIGEHLPIAPECLRPSMWINFRRITLVGLQTPERVTFDSSLTFSTGDAASMDWTHGVIVEVKQERFKPRTPIMLGLRHVRAFPTTLSKYCTGAQLLLPQVKMNRYHPRLRVLRRRFND
jgi:hypothetical protein